MSLEKDITEIRSSLKATELLSEKDIFQPGGPDDIAKREEEQEKELAKQPIKPVDKKAHALDILYWNAYTKISNRLDQLRADHEVDECKCWERLKIDDLDMETTDLPGDGYIDRRCLRCGGWVETG